MEWTSGASQAPALEAAVAECADQVGSGPVDLALVFVSSMFRHRFEEVPGLVSGRLASQVLLGCSGGGVIGGGRELEHTPAVSLVAARLPGVAMHGLRLEADDLPDLDAPPQAWHEALGVTGAEGFVLLSDPFTFDVETLARGLDYAFPAAAKVGGLASDARQPGGNALFLGSEVYRSGMVGLALSGNVRVDTVVAQGCRPIGEPMVITRCREHLLLELDAGTPMQVLHQLVQGLDERDRRLIRHSLFLGMVMDPTRSNPGPGDFLVRNLLGVDPEQDVLAVGAELRPGQTVQFHLRDARTSSEDLARMLGAYVRGAEGAAPAGALLFSCLGRGQHLYGEPDHDTRVFRELVGEVPTGGFFCNGEIGPVGGATYVHGYTSCFGLFREG